MGIKASEAAAHAPALIDKSKFGLMTGKASAENGNSSEGQATSNGFFGNGFHIWGSNMENPENSTASPAGPNVKITTAYFDEDTQILFGLTPGFGKRPSTKAPKVDEELATDVAGKATENNREPPTPVHDTIKAGKTSGVSYWPDGSINGYDNGYSRTIYSLSPKKPDTIRFIQYDTP